MIIYNGTNPTIEKHKAKLGISGDVYLVDGHFMESLESHKKMFPNSEATDISQAQAERVIYEQEQRNLREAQAKEEAELVASTQDDGVVDGDCVDSNADSTCAYCD